MLKLLVLINGLILSQLSYASSELSWGTPKRTELETKISLRKFTNTVTEKNIIEKLLKKIEKSSKLQYFKLVNAKLSTEVIDENFIFMDFYFDTKDLKLLHTSNVYRLRFRWKDEQSYSLYQYFPFLSRAQPIRAEIQFKGDYQKKEEGLYAQETRFELRKESTPFLSGVSLPARPWYKNDFIELAAHGKFQSKEILPFRELKKKIGEKSISMVAPIVTKRFRAHILGSHAPWGSGPNEKHVFIISVDKVFFEDKYLFSEIEIEIDRNTLMQVEHMKNAKAKSFADTLVIKHSQAAYDSLLADLNLLKTWTIQICEELKLLDKNSSQQSINKYQKVMHKNGKS